MPQSTSDQGENFKLHQPGPRPARAQACTMAFMPHGLPRLGLAFLPLTGWVGSQNVWFGGTEGHVPAPCWPGQAARAGVLQGPFFSVLGQAGWGPLKAQTSNPTHPLFCISWVVRKPVHWAGCVACGQPLVLPGPLGHKGLRMDNL